MLLAMVAVCVALGWYVERVRRQREAVATLTKSGAKIEYYERDPVVMGPFTRLTKPRNLAEWAEGTAPSRLRTALGVDFFRRVERADVGGVDELTPALGRLRDLRGLSRLELGVGKALDEDMPFVGALGSLITLNASYADITDAGLAHLTGLRRLESLNLNFTGITDAGLVHLSQLRQLEDLNLSQNRVGDAGLASLGDLRRLKTLDLSFTDVTGPGLRHLTAMHDLENLDMDFTKLGPGGLEHLPSLPRLKSISLQGTAVGDAGLSVLAGLPNLENLNLHWTMVTDAGLASIGSLTKLKQLDLSETAISDSGLRVLVNLTSLQELSIDSTAATSEGAAWLKNRLPKTNIDFQSTGDVAANQAHVLAHAGVWRQALDAIDRFDGPDFQSDTGLRVVGRCHAGLAEWDRAERVFCELFEQIARKPSQWWWTDRVWQELYQWPSLWERVAQARPRDAWRWIASARRAVVEGRWPDAVADYARAADCPHPLDQLVIMHCRVGASIDFQYGVSRLLIGDAAEQRRVCDRLVNAGREIMQSGPSNGFDYNMFAAAHLHLLAPQGTICPSEVADWIGDDTTRVWYRETLRPLIYCRAGEFDKVLEERSAPVGYLPFLWAIAHHHLGHGQQARECFERGSRWLIRRTKGDRVVRVYLNYVGAAYHDAPCLLEVEVLRREAEKLLFGRRAE
ncbi:MAG: leucine-rich repeat domain-containing protein [Pirellulales bacterium]